MTAPQSLDEIIRSRFAAHQERIRQKNDGLASQMTYRDRPFHFFNEVAERLTRTVLRPRLEKLATFFPNARLVSMEEAGCHQAICDFKHTDRYPASAHLQIAVRLDGASGRLHLEYRLEIQPVLFEFPTEDRLSMPLGNVDDREVGEWVDRKIGDFVETYLRLELVEAYQSENMVTDPVCKMSINKHHAGATMEHEGWTYYFCVPECQQKFAANPEQYLLAAQVSTRD